MDNMGNKDSLFFAIKGCYEMVENIISEPKVEGSSVSNKISPEGIKLYNQLANQFNANYSEQKLYIFNEQTTPNQVTHPKAQEVLFQLKYAIDIMGHKIIENKKINKVFISHSSNDKHYGSAIVKLLRGIGLKREQIIFTSDEDYGIPINEDIFDYLKTQINGSAYIIYLLSDSYYNSIPCLNEMGAAWIIQNQYTLIAIPDFDFTNSNFINGAINPRRIGFKMNNEKRIVEFKNIISKEFGLDIDEADWNRVLKAYLTDIISTSGIV